MESDELHEYFVGNIGERIEERNMEWHHLPIPDVDTPKEIFLQRWGYSGLRIRQQLLSGKKVLIHCRGGLGRTGLVAGQLLAEFGWNPDEAIKEIK